MLKLSISKLQQIRSMTFARRIWPVPLSHLSLFSAGSCPAAYAGQPGSQKSKSQCLKHNCLANSLWSFEPKRRNSSQGIFVAPESDSRISFVRSTWRSARDVSDADQFDCGTVSCWTQTSQVKQYPCEHVLGEQEPHVDSGLCDFICQWHNLST